jgi:hypothetical protein
MVENSSVVGNQSNLRAYFIEKSMTIPVIKVYSQPAPMVAEGPSLQCKIANPI